MFRAFSVSDHARVQYKPSVTVLLVYTKGNKPIWQSSVRDEQLSGIYWRVTAAIRGSASLREEDSRTTRHCS